MFLCDLNKLKILLNLSIDDTSKDNLLEIILEETRNDFLQLTNRTDVPESANNVVIQMAVIRYNMIGAEGLSQQSYSGHSESYEYPAQLIKSINRYRKVILV